MGFWNRWSEVVRFFEDDVGGAVVNATNVVVGGAGTVVSQVAGGAITAYKASWGGLDYTVDWSKTTAVATSSWVTSVAGDAADFSVDSYTGARSWCVGAWSQLQALLMGSPPRLGPPNPHARTCIGILLGAGISDAVVSAWERDAQTKGYTMAFNLRGTFSFGVGATAVAGIYVDSTGAWGFFAEAGAGVGLPLPDVSVSIELWMIFAGREAYADKYFMPGLTLKIPTAPTSLPGGGVGQHETPDTGATITLGGNVLLTQNFSFRGFRVLQGISLIKAKLSLSPGSGPMSTNLAAVRLAQEGPGFDAAVRVQTQPANEQAIMVTAMAGKSMIRDMDALFRFDFVRLRSWKNDCLHRPDSPGGVTSWNTGLGNVWRPVRAPGGGFLLKSWKGDHLHRPDSPQGVTTWSATGGSYWTLEPAGEKVGLRSWKGDYLHRPDSPQGVTTWTKGGGSDWFIEGLPGRQPPALQGGWRTCTRCQGLFHGRANGPSVCPHGGAHQAGADDHRIYMGNVPRTLPGGHQDRWRWCGRCGGLHYIGLPTLGQCPAGGVHDITGSGDYWMVASTSETPLLRPGWSWCSRCQGLWYSAGGASRCPAGGAHISTGSGQYLTVKTIDKYTTVPIDDPEQFLEFATFLLRSWKGDYLHRPDGSQGSLTTWPTATTWTAERAEGGRFMLRSWKGDCLHRPDMPSGVTTWSSGIGNEWTIVPGGATIGLRSCKGDYLHRPDSPQGVTTWTAGGGSDWFVEGVHRASS